ncbi:MAG: hypothetical protein P8M30_10400, partial [Planctomycetaceae bacterium]|nr:hypothetical protein [Planctomycetaceae bacterium]
IAFHQYGSNDETRRIFEHENLSTKLNRSPPIDLAQPAKFDSGSWQDFRGLPLRGAPPAEDSQGPTGSRRQLNDDRRTMWLVTTRSACALRR